MKLLKRQKRSKDRNDGSKPTGNTNKVTFLDTQVKFPSKTEMANKINIFEHRKAR